jgi:hypothetical protein
VNAVRRAGVGAGSRRPAPLPERSGVLRMNRRLDRGGFQEGGDKQWDIALAFAQWGKLDLDDIKPEVQILAECSGLNGGIEVAICRGDDADVDAAALRRADRLYLTLLQGAQELGLQIHGHVADFVQKERAAVGGLEQSLLAMKRAGKRTLNDGGLVIHDKYVHGGRLTQNCRFVAHWIKP